MKNTATYRRYEVLVKNVGFVEVVAVSRAAAISDIEQAYYNAEIVTSVERELVRG